MDKLTITVGKYKHIDDSIIVRYDVRTTEQEDDEGVEKTQFETRVDDCADKSRHVVLREAWLAIEDDLKAWAESHGRSKKSKLKQNAVS
jgi:predicted nucleic acid-binding Zn ribbon protein